MDFSLSEDQRTLVAMLRRFIEEKLAPLEETVEREGRLAPEVARDLFEQSKALGFYAMNIPEEFGGGGLSTVDMMLAEEQCVGPQVERWLKPATRGERTCSIAITEPEAGSDAASIRTAATRAGGGWVLDGKKHFISDGLFSDFFVVSAVTDPSAGGRGISLFLVDRDRKGVTIGRDQPMMGLRGTSHVELFFDRVELDDQCLLGEPGRGLGYALDTLGRVRLGQVGARAVGKATKILDLAVGQARERRQFGKAIGEFQLIQKMIADSVIEINAARLLLWNAAAAIDAGRDARALIAMVKVNASETLGRVADRAVQIFGGMGFSRDLPIERYYRDARVYRIFDGTTEIHTAGIARAALKSGGALYDPVEAV